MWLENRNVVSAANLGVMQHSIVQLSQKCLWVVKPPDTKGTNIRLFVTLREPASSRTAEALAEIQRTSS